MDRNLHKVLGYNIDLLTFEKAINCVLENIKNNKGMQIVTINPEIIELANKNQEYAQIINNAELIIPDGSGIKLALKLKGIKQEQIPGIDFTKRLIEKCSENNLSIALVGAKEEVIQKTVNNLQQELQNINICYYRNGYFSDSEENSIINEICEKKPNLILAALGAPKQEIFLTKCREKLNNSICIGVGGSFDVWAGYVARAPEIYRKLGCEWIYRTLNQPQRIKRIYKTLPMFLIKVIIEALKEKFNSKRDKNE